MNQSVATSSSSLTSAADFVGASEVLSPEKSSSFLMRRDVMRAWNSLDLTTRNQRSPGQHIHHSGVVCTLMSSTTSPCFECSRALPAGKAAGSDGCHGMGRASLH
jgi:hypothetical protein